MRMTSGLPGGRYASQSRRAWRRHLVAFLVLLAGLVAPAVARAESRRVLLLYSYEREFAPHNAFAGLFRTDLGRSFQEPIDFVELSLQAARSSRTAPDESAIENIRATVSGRPLDLVVTIGGPAAAFAQTFRSDLFPTVPLLLADVDRRFIDQVTVTPYDTVVAVEHDPAGMIEGILDLLPDTTTIVVVIGSSQLEQFWLREVKREFSRYEQRVEFVWTHDLTFEELLKRCAELPPHSAIFYGVLTLDAAGEPQVEARTLSALHTTANAPVFGLHSSQLGHGIVGGPILSVEALSRNSVDVARRMLRGVAPASILTPVQRAEPPIFDWRELKRWAISEDRLPPGSIVQFREPTRWERDRPIWVTALVVAGAMMAAVLMLRITMKRGGRPESDAADLERLGVPGGGTSVTMWATGSDGRRVHHEHQFRPDHGLSIPIVTELGNGATARVHPDDVGRSMDVFGQALTRREPFQALYRIRGADGGYHQVLDIGVPRFIGDRFAGHVGTTIDLSALAPDRQALSSLSRRLMHDHEQQHASMARALHEDICQRMVGVTMRLHGIVAAPQGEALKQTVRDLCDQLSCLASEIIAMPDPVYRRLELLGFAAAASSLCRDLSMRHQVTIGFRSQDVPQTVPEDVALVLLRVLEEAATNAARHSRSEDVGVSLVGLDDAIQLEITDDGVGFDAEAMPDSEKVGLVSMRERLRMVDGDCDIRSQPGVGTRVRARVPLRAPQWSAASSGHA